MTFCANDDVVRRGDPRVGVTSDGDHSYRVPPASNGVNHSWGISNPKPGASLGVIQPSLGSAMPGSAYPSVRGTPGAVPTKYSHQGTADVA